MSTDSEEPQFLTRRAAVFGLLAGAIGLFSGDAAAQRDAGDRDGRRRRFPGGRRLHRRRRRLRHRRQRYRRQRESIQRGRVKPLFHVMRNFQRRVNVEVLDVNFRQFGPHGVYVFVVLLPGGRIARYFVDGRTEQIFTPPQARRHYGFGN